jgi:hypothetical protein
VLLLVFEEREHRRIAMSLGLAAFLGVWVSHELSGQTGQRFLVGAHLLAACFFAFALYPQAAFPYADLLETNRRRDRNDMEYELLDTGVFKDDRYFDVFVEYAKAGPDDLLVRITAANRGPDTAERHLLALLAPFRHRVAAAANDLRRAPVLGQRLEDLGRFVSNDVLAFGHGAD